MLLVFSKAGWLSSHSSRRCSSKLSKLFQSPGSDALRSSLVLYALICILLALMSSRKLYWLSSTMCFNGCHIVPLPLPETKANRGNAFDGNTSTRAPIHCTQGGV